MTGIGLTGVWRSQPVAARRWIMVAVVVGLLVRLPGVFWGAEWPGGWGGHHPDEYTHLVNAETLIDPGGTPRWDPHPYPKGLAGFVAIPVIAMRAATGRLDAPAPELRLIITWGRVVGVVFGAATILVVGLLGFGLASDWRVGALAAGIVALGGLHVTQSHFFVADATGLFWLLLGMYCCLRDVRTPSGDSSEALRWAAFSFGIAFGVKFVVAGLPTLGVLALRRGPAVRRLLHAGMFFLAGFVVVNFASFTPADLLDAVTRGIGDPYDYNRLAGLGLYLIELPRVISFPVTLLGLAGMVVLTRRFLAGSRDRAFEMGLVWLAPLVVNLFFVVFRVDHFPRHLVLFVPWLAWSAAWMMARVMRYLEAAGRRSAWVPAVVFSYLAVFVYDGERRFLDEPRDAAAEWVMTNVEPGTTYWWRRHPLPGYAYRNFPEDGRPTILVVEMLDANHYLSGIAWRNSYPADARRIFDSISQEVVEAKQAIFRGETEYREVARFSEGYFMPEFVVADRLIGNRSGNYLTELVIFAQDSTRMEVAAGAGS